MEGKRERAAPTIAAYIWTAFDRELDLENFTLESRRDVTQMSHILTHFVVNSESIAGIVAG